MLTWFRQRSIPFRTREFPTPWDAIFFMQHYGVPTRLLDWTENPLIGFFFAVVRSHSRPGPRPDAVVWALDPCCWNQHALRNQSGAAEVLTQDDQPVSSYAPPMPTPSGKPPLAIHGAHNNQRIAAQRGTFVIFGENTDPMERQYAKDNYPRRCLRRILLGKADLLGMRQELLSYGITESVVFPDLDGLARESRRLFGFEV